MFHRKMLTCAYSIRLPKIRLESAKNGGGGGLVEKHLMNSPWTYEKQRL